jgi:hypothetical protein
MVLWCAEICCVVRWPFRSPPSLLAGGVNLHWPCGLALIAAALLCAVLPLRCVLVNLAEQRCDDERERWHARRECVWCGLLQ